MADNFSAITVNNTSLKWSYFHRRALDMVSPEVVFDQLGDKMPLPQKYGDSCTWIKFKKLSPATSVGTEGISPSLIAITSAAITGQVSQFKNAVGYTDALVAMSGVDGMEMMIEKLVAKNVAESIDILARNAMDSAINTTIYGGGKSALSALTSADKLTLAVARQAKLNLEANDVGPHSGGNYAFVGHPNTIYDMVTDVAPGGWIDVFKYTDVGMKQLFNAEVGTADNIRFMKTTLVSKTNSGTSGGAFAYTNMMFGYQPFGCVRLDGYSFKLINHKPGSSGVADPTDEKGSIAWKMWNAWKYFGNETVTGDPDRAVLVKTGRAT